MEKTEVKEEKIAETENNETKKSKKENVPVQNYASMRVTEDELDYYRKKFESLQSVQSLRVHCTSCDKHLGSAVNKQDTRFEHPLLKVLICEKCYDFYTSGDFEKDEDGSELYCRWCGQGGVVYCCAKCPFVFCKKCIKRNMGQGMINYIEANDDWVCYACRPKDIWMHRSMYRALKEFSEQILNEDHVNSPQITEMDTDYSGCCKKRNLSKSKAVAEAKNMKNSAGKVLKVVLEKSTLKRSGSPSNSNQVGENKKRKLTGPSPIDAATHSILADILSVNENDNSDEVVCTPDILNMNDSPPNSPQVELPPNLVKEIDTSSLTSNLVAEVDMNEAQPRKYVQVKPVSQLIQQAVSPNPGPAPPSFQAAFQQNLQKGNDPAHPVVNNMIKSLQNKLKVMSSDGTILYLPAQMNPQSGRQALTTQVMTLTSPQVQTYLQAQSMERQHLVARSTPQLVASSQASATFVQPRIPTQMQFSQSKTPFPQPIRSQSNQQYPPLRPISINNSAPQTWFDTAIMETQTVTQFINTQVNQLINAQKQTINTDSLYDYFQTKLQFCLDKVSDVKRNLEINFCLSKGEPLPKKSETFNKSQNSSYQSYTRTKKTSNQRNTNSSQSTSNTKNSRIILPKNTRDLRNSNLRTGGMNYKVIRPEITRKGKKPVEPTVQSDGLFDMDVTCDETSDDERKLREKTQKVVEIVEIVSDSDSSVEEISDNEEADPMWEPENFPVVLINENGDDDEKNSSDEDEIDAFHNIGNDNEEANKNSDDNAEVEEDTAKTSENDKNDNGGEDETKNSDDDNSNGGNDVKDSDDENNITKNSADDDQMETSDNENNATKNSGADDDKTENSDNENNTSKNSSADDDKMETSDNENNTTKNSGADDKIEISDSEGGKKDGSDKNESQNKVDKKLTDKENSKNKHSKKDKSITPSDMLLIAHALRESMKDQTTQKRKKSADDLEKLLSSNVVYRNNDRTDGEEDETSKNDEENETSNKNDDSQDDGNADQSCDENKASKNDDNQKENNKSKTFDDAFSTFISNAATDVNEESEQNTDDDEQEPSNDQSSDKKSVTSNASETNELNSNPVSSPPPPSNEDLESEIIALQKMAEDCIAGTIDTENSANEQSSVHENTNEEGDKTGEKNKCDISVNINDDISVDINDDSSVNISDTISKNDTIVESVT